MVGFIYIYKDQQLMMDEQKVHKNKLLHTSTEKTWMNQKSAARSDFIIKKRV